MSFIAHVAGTLGQRGSQAYASLPKMLQRQLGPAEKKAEIDGPVSGGNDRVQMAVEEDPILAKCIELPIFHPLRLKNRS